MLFVFCLWRMDAYMPDYTAAEAYTAVYPLSAQASLQACFGGSSRVGGTALSHAQARSAGVTTPCPSSWAVDKSLSWRRLDVMPLPEKLLCESAQHVGLASDHT